MINIFEDMIKFQKPLYTSSSVWPGSRSGAFCHFLECCGEKYITMAVLLIWLCIICPLKSQELILSAPLPPGFLEINFYLSSLPPELFWYEPFKNGIGTIAKLCSSPCQRRRDHFLAISIRNLMEVFWWCLYFMKVFW